MNTFNEDSFRTWTEALQGSVRTADAKPKVLLVDDDPVFCKMMRAVALRDDVELNTISSAREFQSLADSKKSQYDAVIVDYHLGAFRGPALCSKIGSSPVLLISGNDIPITDTRADWPPTIKSFSRKSLGPWEILAKAKRLATFSPSRVQAVLNDFLSPEEEKQIVWRFILFTAILGFALVAGQIFHPRLDKSHSDADPWSSERQSLSNSWFQ